MESTSIDTINPLFIRDIFFAICEYLSAGDKNTLRITCKTFYGWLDLIATDMKRHAVASSMEYVRYIRLRPTLKNYAKYLAHSKSVDIVEYLMSGDDASPDKYEKIMRVEGVINSVDEHANYDVTKWYYGQRYRLNNGPIVHDPYHVIARGDLPRLSIVWDYCTRDSWDYAIDHACEHKQVGVAKWLCERVAISNAFRARTLINIIHLGDTELLQWFSDNGHFADNTVITSAYPPLSSVKWFAEQGKLGQLHIDVSYAKGLEPELIEYLCKTGGHDKLFAEITKSELYLHSIPTLECLHSKNLLEVTVEKFMSCVHRARMEVAMWVYERGLINIDDIQGVKNVSDTLTSSYALSSDRHMKKYVSASHRSDKPPTLDALKWLHKIGGGHSLTPDRMMLKRMITTDDIVACRWYYSVADNQADFWGDRTMAYVITKSSLRMVKFAHETGCPRDIHTFTTAIEHGDTAIIQFLYDAGYVVNRAEVLVVAARYQPELYDWLVALLG